MINVLIRRLRANKSRNKEHSDKPRNTQGLPEAGGRARKHAPLAPQRGPGRHPDWAFLASRITREWISIV